MSPILTILICRFKSSILPIEFQDVTIIETREIYKTKGFGLYRDSSVSLHIALTSIGNIFIVADGYHLLSDGGEFVNASYAFKELQHATNCYVYFENHYRFGLKEEMNNVVIISCPGKPKRYIDGAENYKGFIITRLYHGDLLVPYFNRQILSNLGLEEKADALHEADIRILVGTEFEPALLKWGINENGILIEEDAYLSSKALLNSKSVSFTRHPVNDGFYNYELIGRYPHDVFKAMKLERNNEGLGGWFTMNPVQVHKRLNVMGWRIRIDNMIMMYYLIGEDFPIFKGLGCAETCFSETNGSFFNILYYIENPTACDIKIWNRGDLQYGLYSKDNIPFFIIYFLDVDWNFKVSTNFLKVPASARDEWLQKGSAFNVTLFLINANTNVLEAMRTISITVETVNKLKDTLEAQTNTYNSIESVDTKTKSILESITTSKMMQRTKIFTLKKIRLDVLKLKRLAKPKLDADF